MSAILDYVPRDRRRALAAGTALPERTAGAALFADIAGFTPATEAIARAFGPQRGAEELLAIVNPIYEALTAEIDRYGGSVIGFSGDALTVWFDDQRLAASGLGLERRQLQAPSPKPQASAGLRAVACALAMQAAMARFQAVAVPGGQVLSLGLKTTVACGPIRRLLVGDPATQLIEVLAGATMARLAAAAGLTRAGEVVLDVRASRLLGRQISIAGWRSGAGARRCAIVGGLAAPAEPQPWPPIPGGALSDEQVRPWLLPPVYARLRSGQGEFLSELRQTVSLFLRFADLDYERDDRAGPRLDAFVRWVQGVLARHAGWLLQVTLGDKGSYLYAAFGAPIAHGDDAARAVGAAVDLRAPPPELAYAGPVQIGIGGGQSRAGALGGTTRTYSVMGAATNLAARLMEAAASGQVLVSAHLAAAVSRHYELDPLPPIKAKGVAELVPIVAVRGPRAAPAIHLQEPQYALPLVGRGAEIALIEHKIALAVGGQGQVLGITGEAGIGKSRLVAEAVRRAAEAGFVGYGGAAQPSGTQMAYHAWQPIWRAFFGLDPAASVAAQAAALERAIASLDPALLPRLPLLGPALGLPLPESELTRGLDARQRKEALEALLADCLKARLAAGAPPMLLVIEDAHWLDALSLDLLAVVGQALAGLPALLALAYRPLEADRGQPLPVARMPYHDEIGLGELSPAEAARLIAEKVALQFGPRQALLEPFVEAITARAEGNPFYIEELLNYLQDRGVAPGDLAALERLELPGSLASLILSRIDQLTTEQQTTLKVASVIGRVFREAWLWGVHPGLGAAEQVRQDLETLWRLDITPLDTPAPDLSYVFKHATTQEVAYESLPFALRAQLHEQLAAWLEDQPGDGVSLDLLAYHYGHSSNAAKQREYFQKAGDAATARYANAAAIQYYERLLALLPAAEQAPALVAIGGILENTSAWDVAEQRYRAGLALAEAAEDAELRARAQLGIGNTLWNRARYDEALEWLDQARRGFEALGDRVGLITTLFNTARANWYRGNNDAAQALAEQSLELEGAEGDKGRIAVAYQILGSVAIWRQDYAQARAWQLKSLAMKRALGDRVSVANSTTNLAMMAFMDGQLGEARMLSLEAIALFQAIGARWGMGIARSVLGFVTAAQGDPAGGLAIQRETLALFRDLGSMASLDTALVGIAHAAQLAGPAGDADRYAVQLLAASERLNGELKVARIPVYQTIADGIVARAQARLGPDAVEQAWRVGRAMEWQPAVAYALTGELDAA